MAKRGDVIDGVVQVAAALLGGVAVWVSPSHTGDHIAAGAFCGFFAGAGAVATLRGELWYRDRRVGPWKLLRGTAARVVGVVILIVAIAACWAVGHVVK